MKHSHFVGGSTKWHNCFGEPWFYYYETINVKVLSHPERPLPGFYIQKLKIDIFKNTYSKLETTEQMNG